MARILIVDDSSTIRQMLRDILTRAGHEIVGEAENGVKGYLEYVRLKPDIVTMDLGMPMMNGLVAMSKILAPFPDARFVAISAMEERKVVLEALQRGARGFLLKPFSEEQVVEAIASILKQPFSTREYRERVRRHRQAKSWDAEPAVEEIRSPFDIERAANGALRIEINANFSSASSAVLAEEVNRICSQESPGVLFDFGMVDRLDGAALKSLDALMNELHQGCGGVRASAANDKFIRQIHSEHEATGGLPFMVLLLEETKIG